MPNISLTLTKLVTRRPRRSYSCLAGLWRLSAIKDAEAVRIGSVVFVKDYKSLNPIVQWELKNPYFMAFQTLTYNIVVAPAMAMPPGRSRWSTPCTLSIREQRRRRIPTERPASHTRKGSSTSFGGNVLQSAEDWAFWWLSMARRFVSNVRTPASMARTVVSKARTPALTASCTR